MSALTERPHEYWEDLSCQQYGTQDYADWLRLADRDQQAARAGLCQCCMGMLKGQPLKPTETKATTVYTTHHGYRVLLCDACRDVWVAEDPPGSQYSPQSMVPL